MAVPFCSTQDTISTSVLVRSMPRATSTYHYCQYLNIPYSLLTSSFYFPVHTNLQLLPLLNSGFHQQNVFFATLFRIYLSLNWLVRGRSTGVTSSPTSWSIIPLSTTLTSQFGQMSRPPSQPSIKPYHCGYDSSEMTFPLQFELLLEVEVVKKWQNTGNTMTSGVVVKLALFSQLM